MNLKVLLFCLLFVPFSVVYGHGVGLDTIKSINIGEKKANISVQITPTEFNPDSEKKIVIITSDSETNQNIQDVTLKIALYHQNLQIFNELFFSPDGTIHIQVHPSQQDAPVIKGIKVGDAYESSSASPVILEGPVFSEGGLYHFEIELKSAGGLKNLHQDTYVADVTLVTNQFYNQNDKGGNLVNFGVRSYYDVASNFEYESDSNSVTFEIPFDWSEKNISHLQVVHIEVHFPKKFTDFFVPSYKGKLNGIDLFKSAVVIDDYSDQDRRIVHFVVSQDTIRYLKQIQKNAGLDPQNMKFTLEPSHEIVFPLSAQTRDERIQVDLSWDPAVIEPNKKIKFIYTFRDAKTGEVLRNTEYDFVIVQGGQTIYKKSANAKIGGDFAEYTFAESQQGLTSIKFENIQGHGNTEFGITVVPEFGHAVFVVFLVGVIFYLVLSNKYIPRYCR